MFWSASRLMSKPVRLLARRTDSYVHAHAVLRSPMRLFGAVAGASADSYDAGDDNDGIGNGAGVGSDAGAAADSGHAGTVAFAGTSAGTFAGTPSFYEAIDIADVVRAQAAADSFHIGAVRVRAADRGRGGGRVVAVRHAGAFRAALGRDIRFGGSHGCRMAVSDGDGGVGTGARIQSAACRGRTAGIGRGGRSVHYQTGWHCRRC